MPRVEIQRLSDLHGEAPERMPTGFKELDIAYGKNVRYDRGREVWDIGLPRGRVSVWAGSGGIGKSRLAKVVGMQMCSFYGNKVLYLLNEDDPNAFASWSDNLNGNYDFFVSHCDSVEDQIEAIYSTNPDLVVIDSFTGVGGTESSGNIRSIMKQYKNTTSEIGCHTILIAHLNKENEIKGNNDLIYYPDTVCELTKINTKGCNEKELRALNNGNGYFLMKFSSKNRGAPVGSWLCFRHTEGGVEMVDSKIVGYND